MSSASFSIETPALTRRTFDCESTSLLKGMSRDDDRMIFLAAFAMMIYSATGAESLSLDFQPVTDKGAALSLPLCRSSGKQAQAAATQRRSRSVAAAACSSRSLSTMLPACRAASA